MHKLVCVVLAAKEKHYLPLITHPSHRLLDILPSSLLLIASVLPHAFMYLVYFMFISQVFLYNHIH